MLQIYILVKIILYIIIITTKKQKYKKATFPPSLSITYKSNSRRWPLTMFKCIKTSSCSQLSYIQLRTKYNKAECGYISTLFQSHYQTNWLTSKQQSIYGTCLKRLHWIVKEWYQEITYYKLWKEIRQFQGFGWRRQFSDNTDSQMQIYTQYIKWHKEKSDSSLLAFKNIVHIKHIRFNSLPAKVLPLTSKIFWR